MSIILMSVSYDGVPQVDNPTSLENIETKVSACLSRAEIVVHSFSTLIQPSKWLDEILEYCPGVKVCHPFETHFDTF
jgi:hypothetical protein